MVATAVEPARLTSPAVNGFTALAHLRGAGSPRHDVVDRRPVGLPGELLPVPGDTEDEAVAMANDSE